MTDTEYMELIQVETDTVEDHTVETYLPSWWGMLSSETTTELRYLKTKKKVLEYLLGKARKKRDISSGQDKISASQEFAQTLKLLQALDTEIAGKDTTSPSRARLSVSPVKSSLPDSLGANCRSRPFYYPED